MGALLFLSSAYVGWRVVAYGRDVRRIWDVAPPDIAASRDSAVIVRGRHLAEALGGCLGCHGPGLAGQPGEDLGSIGSMHAPNLTSGRGGVGARYTDATFGRAVRNGIRHDGTTVRFMPSMEFNWWPNEDLTALVSYWRTLPPVDNEVPPTRVGLMGKVLDQMDMLPITIATRIDHDTRPSAPAPAPTASYGAYLARGCLGCHGETMSGGKIPGAPADLAIPANLTRHETGLASWTYEDFVRLLDTGRRPDSSQVDPFMPTSSTRFMNDVEKAALWAYVQSLEPRAFGNR